MFNNRVVSVIVILLFSLSGCFSGSNKKATDSSDLNGGNTINSKKSKALGYSKKTVDSLIKAGVISEGDLSSSPSQAEEREKLKKEYDKIEIIDSTFISDNDTLHFRLKYYCLKDSDLVVPKYYDSETKPPKAFVTHPFVADISLTKNKRVVLNKQFKGNDSTPFFKDNFGGNLKRYGSLLAFYLLKKNKDKNQIALAYSFSIPTTDIGIGLVLLISKNGDYKVVENY